MDHLILILAAAAGLLELVLTFKLFYNHWHDMPGDYSRHDVVNLFRGEYVDAWWARVKFSFYLAGGVLTGMLAHHWLEKLLL